MVIFCLGLSGADESSEINLVKKGRRRNVSNYLFKNILLYIYICKWAFERRFDWRDSSICRAVARQAKGLGSSLS